MSVNDSRSNMLGQVDPLSTGDNGLPYPWQCLFDDEYQAYYYFNPLTNEQQWADINEDMQGNQVEHTDNHNEYEYQDFNEDGSTYLDELDGESISNMSRTSSVFERSTQMLASKKEREEALRLELKQREESELRSGPEINKRSKQMNRNVDDMFTWEEKRKQKMELLAQQRRAEEVSQNTGKPILYSHKSSSNASVCTTGSGDSSSIPVEERLLAYEEKRRLKLQQTIAQEKSDARKASIPTIAPHSMNLNRRRLESNSSTGSGSTGNSRSVGSSGGNAGILRDHSTGQIMFQPKLNPTSQRIASQSRPSTVPIEELLTGKGLLAQQRLAEKESRQQQRDQALRQVSKVNPKSERLVQERYILQGETTQDRLQRSIGNVKSKTLEEIERPSFKPTINPNSAEIASAASGHQFHYTPRDHGNTTGSGREGYLSPNQAYFEQFHQSTHSTYYTGEEGNNGSTYYGGDEGVNAYGSTDGPLLYEDLVRNSTSRGNAYTNSSNNNSSYQPQQEDAMFNKAQRWEASRKLKLEKERKERERKEKEICTFKPKIDSTRRGRSVADRGSAGGSYIERQESWVERREQKLEAERRKAAEKELEGCSFVPALRSAATGVAANNTASAGVGQGGRRDKGTSERETGREPPYYLTAEGTEEHWGQSISKSGADHHQEYNEDVYTEHAPAPPVARIPLPSKSTVSHVPQNQALSVPQYANQRQFQPSKVSISVPSVEENYTVDYEPSPSSGVMLARTALAQPARHDLQFDQYWAHQQELERQEQQLQDGVEYGLDESDNVDANAHYSSGLPFQASLSTSSCSISHREGANLPKQLFASPPYSRNERTTTAAATLEALRSYPYDSLMEPDDQDFGALSLADVAGTTEMPRYHHSSAAAENRATVAGSGGLYPPSASTLYEGAHNEAGHYVEEGHHPPPPPPPIRPPVWSTTATGAGEAVHPSPPPPYKTSSSSSSSSRNVRFVSQDPSATAPTTEDVMQGVEFSPSPVKIPRNVMYDML